MIKFIKRLFCRHNYIPLGIVIGKDNSYYNREKYMMCKCGKCGKAKALRMY